MKLRTSKTVYSELWEHDREYQLKKGIIAGVDEVGRGPLAGNVVSACVILNLGEPIPGVRDSKKIPEAHRGPLCTTLKKKALHYGLGQCSPQEIDKLNILQATFLSMKRAVSQLSVTPDFILVDGNKEIPGLNIPQICIVKGDGKSASIAAASILAKVTRDEQMEKYHREYPHYDFIHNKGYGSKLHIQSLREKGPSPIHRKSFKVKALNS